MNRRMIATALSLSSLMLTVSIYSAVANGWCLFNCKPEKTKEQCEAENEKLRTESMGAGQDQGMAAGTGYGGVGMAAGAIVGAAAGYAAGWWKGEDCEKYPSENK